MIKMKDLLVTEAIQADFQRTRQELLTALRELTYKVDNAHSPREAGASGHDPKREAKAIAETNKFKTKVHHLGMEWKALVSTF